MQLDTNSYLQHDESDVLTTTLEDTHVSISSEILEDSKILDTNSHIPNNYDEIYTILYDNNYKLNFTFNPKPLNSSDNNYTTQIENNIINTLQSYNFHLILLSVVKILQLEINRKISIPIIDGHLQECNISNLILILLRWLCTIDMSDNYNMYSKIINNILKYIIIIKNNNDSTNLKIIDIEEALIDINKITINANDIDKLDNLQLDIVSSILDSNKYFVINMINDDVFNNNIIINKVSETDKYYTLNNINNKYRIIIIINNNKAPIYLNKYITFIFNSIINYKLSNTILYHKYNTINDFLGLLNSNNDDCININGIDSSIQHLHISYIIKYAIYIPT